MLERLFPRALDNAFRGHWLALWLLGAFVALKLVMSLNSIFNTESVAAGADGVPLDSFGSAAAREVLTLFALTALGQLALALIALTALIRYRSAAPLIYLVLLGEALGRRVIVQSFELVRTDSGAAGTYINYAILAWLALGLVLSLLPGASRAAAVERLVRR